MAKKGRRGEGQKGRRRGRYKTRIPPHLTVIDGAPPRPEPTHEEPVRLVPEMPKWDQEHHDRLFKQSPLPDDSKRDAAYHATLLHARIVEMSGRLLGVEEQANLRGFTGAYRKLLEFLKIQSAKKAGGRGALLGTAPAGAPGDDDEEEGD